MLVMTFYRFAPLADLPALREAVEGDAAALGLRGTVLLAEEGVNASLAGSRPALEAFAARLAKRVGGLAKRVGGLTQRVGGLEERAGGLTGLRPRFSPAAPGNPVFQRLKVRIREEIVRLAQPGVMPHRRTGEHVDAARWHHLLDDPEVVVLDARNRYEVAIGTFPGARDPDTRSFRQLPDYVRRHLDPARHRQVAMFCTGGIRCEKASAWMLDQGFEAVYQLDGGILGYLESVAPEESRWQGECFVFDERGALNTLSVPAPAPR